jgi:hypothetical protein
MSAMALGVIIAEGDEGTTLERGVSMWSGMVDDGESQLHDGRRPSRWSIACCSDGTMTLVLLACGVDNSEAHEEVERGVAGTQSDLEVA